MKRNPILHIRLSDLRKILGNDIDYKNLLIESNKVRVKNMFAITTNKKTVLDSIINNYKKLDDSYVKNFQEVLVNYRKSLGHAHVQIITQTHSHYKTLVELSSLLKKFCDDFNLDYRIGCLEYLKIAIKKIGSKYNINRLKYFYNDVYEKYVEKLIIQEDDSYETEKIVAYYKSKLNNDLFTYNIIDFIECKKYIGDYDYKDWIDAQFEQMSFMDVQPLPEQLHGENALNRFQKWWLLNKSKKPKELNNAFIEKFKNRYK